MKKLLFLLILILPWNAQAGLVDRYAVDVGSSYKGVWLARALLQWDWLKGSDGFCSCDFSYLEVDVGQWIAKADPNRTPLLDIGIKPVFRLQRGPLFSWFPGRPFLEGGVGIHYLSDISIPGTRFFTSTQFQFGEHFAWGFVFGAKGQFTISQRFLHLSNAYIREPNPGINYKLVHMAFRF